jgi:hypothetical protein
MAASQHNDLIDVSAMLGAYPALAERYGADFSFLATVIQQSFSSIFDLQILERIQATQPKTKPIRRRARTEQQTASSYLHFFHLCAEIIVSASNAGVDYAGLALSLAFSDETHPVSHYAQHSIIVLDTDAEQVALLEQIAIQQKPSLNPVIPLDLLDMWRVIVGLRVEAASGPHSSNHAATSSAAVTAPPLPALHVLQLHQLHIWKQSPASTDFQGCLIINFHPVGTTPKWGIIDFRQAVPVVYCSLLLSEYEEQQVKTQLLLDHFSLDPACGTDSDVAASGYATTMWLSTQLSETPSTILQKKSMLSDFVFSLERVLLLSLPDLPLTSGQSFVLENERTSIPHHNNLGNFIYGQKEFGYDHTRSIIRQFFPSSSRAHIAALSTFTIDPRHRITVASHEKSIHIDMQRATPTQLPDQSERTQLCQDLVSIFGLTTHYKKITIEVAQPDISELTQEQLRMIYWFVEKNAVTTEISIQFKDLEHWYQVSTSRSTGGPQGYATTMSHKQFDCRNYVVYLCGARRESDYFSLSGDNARRTLMVSGTGDKLWYGIYDEGKFPNYRNPKLSYVICPEELPNTNISEIKTEDALEKAKLQILQLTAERGHTHRDSPLTPLRVRLRSVLGRNRLLEVYGYLPQEGADHWRAAIKYWLQYLYENTAESLLEDHEKNRTIKQCITDMGMEGLQKLFQFLVEEPQYAAHLFGQSKPPFYIAIGGDEAYRVGAQADGNFLYLQTLKGLIEQVNLSYFSEFVVRYHLAGDKSFKGLYELISERGAFSRIVVDATPANAPRAVSLLSQSEFKAMIEVPALSESQLPLVDRRALWSRDSYVSFQNDQLQRYWQYGQGQLLSSIAIESQTPFSSSSSVPSCSSSVMLHEAYPDSSSSIESSNILESSAPRSWPLNRESDGRPALEVSQQLTVTFEQQRQQEVGVSVLHQQDAIVTGSVLEPALGELVSYENVTQLLQEAYEKLENKTKFDKIYQALANGEETPLQAFFRICISANPRVASPDIISRMTLSAAEELLKNATHLVSGLVPRHLPKGFYIQASETGQSILGYKAERMYEVAKTPLTLELEKVIPTVKPWTGDYRLWLLFDPALAAIELTPWTGDFEQLLSEKDKKNISRQQQSLAQKKDELWPDRAKCYKKLWHTDRYLADYTFAPEMSYMEHLAGHSHTRIRKMHYFSLFQPPQDDVEREQQIIDFYNSLPETLKKDYDLWEKRDRKRKGDRNQDKFETMREYWPVISQWLSWRKKQVINGDWPKDVFDPHSFAAFLVILSETLCSGLPSPRPEDIICELIQVDKESDIYEWLQKSGLAADPESFKRLGQIYHRHGPDKLREFLEERRNGTLALPLMQRFAMLQPEQNQDVLIQAFLESPLFTEMSFSQEEREKYSTIIRENWCVFSQYLVSLATKNLQEDMIGFLSLLEQTKTLTVRQVLEDLLADQTSAPVLINWLESEGLLHQKMLIALGQVYHSKYHAAGIITLLQAFKKIADELGQDFFRSLYEHIFSKNDAYADYLMTHEFFDMVVEWCRQLKDMQDVGKRAAWQSLYIKHFIAVGWDSTESLWNGFKFFFSQLELMGIEDHYDYFANIDAQNMLVLMDRILIILSGLPNKQKRLDVLAHLAELDLSQGGLVSAVQHGFVQVLDPSLALHDFDGDLPYSPDLENMYNESDERWTTDLKFVQRQIKRAFASQIRFNQHYTDLAKWVDSVEDLQTLKDSSFLMLHTDCRDLSNFRNKVSAIIAAYPGISAFLYKAIYQDHQDLSTLQLDTLHYFKDQLSNNLTGTLLQALNIVYQVSSRTPEAAADIYSQWHDFFDSLNSEAVAVYPAYIRHQAARLCVLFNVSDLEKFQILCQNMYSLPRSMQGAFANYLSQFFSIDLSVVSPDAQCLMDVLGCEENWNRLLACFLPASAGLSFAQFIKHLSEEQGIVFSRSGQFKVLNDPQDKPIALDVFKSHQERLWKFLCAHVAVPVSGSAQETLEPLIQWLKALQEKPTYFQELESLLSCLEKTPANHYWSVEYLLGLLRKIEPTVQADPFPIGLLEAMLEREPTAAKPLGQVEGQCPNYLMEALDRVLPDKRITAPQKAMYFQLASKLFAWGRADDIINTLNQIATRLNEPAWSQTREATLTLLANTTAASFDETLVRCQWLLAQVKHIKVHGDRTGALWLQAINDGEEDALELLQRIQAAPASDKKIVILYIIAWSSLSIGLKTPQAHKYERMKKMPKLFAMLDRLSLKQLMTLAACYPKRPAPTATDLLHMDKDQSIPLWKDKVHHFLKKPYHQPRADHGALSAIRQVEFERMLQEIAISQGAERKSLPANIVLRLSLMFVQLKNLEQGASLTLPNGTAIAISDMTEEQIRDAFKQLSQTLETDPENDYLKVKIWALLFEAIWRTTGKYPHMAQQVALLAADIAFLTENKFLQLATSQGKTHLIALRAARHTGQGSHKIYDIHAAKRSLPQQDFAEYKHFFDFIGIKASLIHPKSPRATYTESQVHYGSAEDYSLFFDEQSNLMRPIPMNIPDRVAGCDEADFILKDKNEIPSNYATSLRNVSPKEMVWFYEVVNQFYREHLAAKGDAGDITAEDLEQFNIALIQATNNRSEKLRLIESLNTVERVVWLQSAYLAHRLVQGVDFTVIEETFTLGEETRKVREIVPLSTDAQRMDGSTFSLGVHQLLAVRLNETTEFKNHHVHPETAIMSSQVVKKNLAERYEAIECFSATISPEQQKLWDGYFQGLQVLQVPTNQPTLRHGDTLFYSNADERFAATVAHIRQCISDKKSILFGCSTDKDVNALKEALEKRLTPKEMTHIIFYTNEDPRTASQVLRDKHQQENWKAGRRQTSVTLAAAGFGRGDNVHVYVTLLFDVKDINDFEQKIGRVARNGEKGEYHQLLLKEDIDQEYAILVARGVANTQHLAGQDEQQSYRNKYAEILKFREIDSYEASFEKEQYNEAWAEFTGWAMQYKATHPSEKRTFEIAFARENDQLRKFWTESSSLGAGTSIERITQLKQRMIEAKDRLAKDNVVLFKPKSKVSRSTPETAAKKNNAAKDDVIKKVSMKLATLSAQRPLTEQRLYAIESQIEAIAENPQKSSLLLEEMGRYDSLEALEKGLKSIKSRAQPTFWGNTYVFESVKATKISKGVKSDYLKALVERLPDISIWKPELLTQLINIADSHLFYAERMALLATWEVWLKEVSLNERHTLSWLSDFCKVMMTSKTEADLACFQQLVAHITQAWREPHYEALLVLWHRLALHAEQFSELMTLLETCWEQDETSWFKWLSTSLQLSPDLLREQQEPLSALIKGLTSSTKFRKEIKLEFFSLLVAQIQEGRLNLTSQHVDQVLTLVERYDLNTLMKLMQLINDREFAVGTLLFSDIAAYLLRMEGLTDKDGTVLLEGQAADNGVFVRNFLRQFEQARQDAGRDEIVSQAFNTQIQTSFSPATRKDKPAGIQKTANRVIWMDVLNRGILLSDVGHELSFSGLTSDENQRLLNERWIAYCDLSKRALALRPHKMTYDAPRDLVPRQQAFLLRFSDELSLLGERRLSPDHILETRNDMRGLSTKLRKLMKHYDAAWFKSEARERCLTTLRTQVEAIFSAPPIAAENASQLSRYERLLDVLSEQKQQALAQDFAVARRDMGINRNGRSRYINTLNQMQDAVLRAWAQDPAAVHRFGAYVKRSEKDLVVLTKKMEEMLVSQLMHNRLPPRLTVDQSLRMLTAGYHNQEPSPPTSSPWHPLYQSLHNLSQEQTSISPEELTTCITELTTKLPLLSGHSKLLAEELLASASALQGFYQPSPVSRDFLIKPTITATTNNTAADNPPPPSPTP